MPWEPRSSSPRVDSEQRSLEEKVPIHLLSVTNPPKGPRVELRAMSLECHLHVSHLVKIGLFGGLEVTHEILHVKKVPGEVGPHTTQ